MTYPYLERMPALSLSDYHGRVVSLDGRTVFSICGHDMAPTVLWVVKYIDGEPTHARRVPCALSPSAVRLPLHFDEGLAYALRWLARQLGGRLDPGEVPRWYHDGGGGFGLATRVGKIQYFGAPGRVRPWEHGEEHAVPTLTDGMGRIDGLAAAIAWVVSR